MINRAFKLTIISALLAFGCLSGCTSNGISKPAKNASKLQNSSENWNELQWGYVGYYFGGKMVFGSTRHANLIIAPRLPDEPFDEVAHVASSCGCLRTSIRPAGKRASDGIRVRATYIANNMGHDRQTMRLLSKDGKLLGMIEIFANVVPKFSITPQELKLVDTRKMKPNKITIVSNVYCPKKWTVVEAPSFMDVSVSRPVKNKTTLICQLKRAPTPGMIDTQIKLIPDNKPEDDISVSIKGYISGKISCSPETIYLGTVAKGRSSLSTFQLMKSQADSKITSLKAISDHQDMKITLKKNQNKDIWSGSVEIKNGSKVTSIRRGTILISDNQGNQLLRIPYRATLL